MQDLSSGSNGNNVSGKMDSNSNANARNNNDNDDMSQGSLSTLKNLLPVVKYVGSSTKDFFVSGKFKQTIRSPIEFINPRLLSIPPTMGDALTRLGTNWGFYKSNYAIITFLCCVGWIISSPTSLIVLGVLFTVWYYTIKTSNSTLQIGETKYGPMQKYMVAILITLVATLFFGIIGTLVGGMSVGAGISTIHGVCHVRRSTEHSQLRDLNDIEKGNDAILTAAANANIDDFDHDGATEFNGIELMQMDDESFPVNEVKSQNLNNGNSNDNENENENDNSYNNYNNNNNHQSIFENDDAEPELGIN